MIFEYLQSLSDRISSFTKGEGTPRVFMEMPSQRERCVVFTGIIHGQMSSGMLLAADYKLFQHRERQFVGEEFLG